MLVRVFIGAGSVLLGAKLQTFKQACEARFQYCSRARSRSHAGTILEYMGMQLMCTLVLVESRRLLTSADARSKQHSLSCSMRCCSIKAPDQIGTLDVQKTFCLQSLDPSASFRSMQVCRPTCPGIPVLSAVQIQCVGCPRQQDVPA